MLFYFYAGRGEMGRLKLVSGPTFFFLREFECLFVNSEGGSCFDVSDYNRIQGIRGRTQKRKRVFFCVCVTDSAKRNRKKTIFCFASICFLFFSFSLCFFFFLFALL